jgi:hypothetical protein
MKDKLPFFFSRFSSIQIIYEFFSPLRDIAAPHRSENLKALLKPYMRDATAYALLLWYFPWSEASTAARVAQKSTILRR